MEYFFQKLRMIFTIIFSLFYLSSIASISNKKYSENTPIGMWQTMLEEKGTELILILDIRTTETDSLECLMHFPEFGFSNLPHGKFVLNEGKGWKTDNRIYIF